MAPRSKRIAPGYNGYFPWGLYYHLNGNPISLPLLNVRAEASIKELAAPVKLTHIYGNDADFDIEAIYSFPIPAKAAVCSFVMIKQDGTRVIGKIEEKKEAREAYETAIAEGKQAALMEQQTPDVFQLAVGNIPSKTQVQIELIYATVVSEDEENDSIRLLLPMQIGARYGEQPYSTADFPGPHYLFRSQNTTFLQISVQIEAAAPIAKISSPSHPVSTELGPDPALPNANELPFANYARISLSSDSALDKDFILTVKAAGLDSPRCIAELHPVHPTVAFALTLVPRFRLPDLAKQEFVFLIDRSGSMSGPRIKAAKAALVVMLRSLPAKDSFVQIASFGDKSRGQDYGELWRDGDPQSVAYVLREPPDRPPDRPTSVFVLTDGEVWDLEGVFAEVKAAVAAAPAQGYLRVFVLGIGNSASTAMCEGIARVGNGTCMMVGDQETNFTGNIARMLKGARAPLIFDIAVDWGVGSGDATDENQANAGATVDEDDAHEESSAGNVTGNEKDKGKQKQKTLNVFDDTVDPMQLDNESVPPPPPVVLPTPSKVQQSPFKIQTIMPGNRLNVYAILQGKTVPNIVTLTGVTEDGAEIRLPVPVTLTNLPNAPEAPPAVHALCARTMIQDLEDGQHAIAIEDPDLLARTVEASIVRLGKTFSISSSATSFVAVDESPASNRIRHPDVVQIPMVGNSIVTSLRPSRAQPGFRGRVGGRGSLGGGRGSLGGGRGSLGGGRGSLGGGRGSLGGGRGRGGGRGGRTKITARGGPFEKQLYRVTGSRAARGSAVASAVMHTIQDDSDSGDEDDDEPTNSWGQTNLERLARHQSFDGGFSLAVLSVVQLTVDVAKARATLLDGISDEIFATILAIAFMARKLGPEVERDSWEAMYDKARAFVEGAVTVSVDELETKAISMLA
ncbi:vault protein inter-alpha-trypsin domain-containing protein [Mycena sanguinolenta]|nr:vault protein inter-alpha-trypsin domain-containing protein [Mycena sanguinolenta]